MRQVAGPDGGAAIAQPQIDANLYLLPLEMRGDRRFVIAFYRQAPGGDLRGAEADRQRVAVGGFARLADGSDDAAPIGVFAGDRGLDQRRIGRRRAAEYRRARLPS